MKSSSLLLTCLFSIYASTLSVCSPAVSGQEVLFEDRFEGDVLMPGWEGLRGDVPYCRLVNNALELLTEPFASGEARNALVRPLNFLCWRNGHAVGSYRFETECYFLEKPTTRAQQCGLYWIQNNRVIFKLVFANGDDNKIYVYPGKVPIETSGGKLRLTVTGRNVIAEFSSPDDATFRRVYEGRINGAPGDRISLQCLGGKKDVPMTPQAGQSSWARFQYFRIEKLDE